MADGSLASLRDDMDVPYWGGMKMVAGGARHHFSFFGLLRLVVNIIALIFLFLFVRLYSCSLEK